MKLEARIAELLQKAPNKKVEKRIKELEEKIPKGSQPPKEETERYRT